MGYFKDTLKGISWTAALRVVIRSLTIIKTAILARVFLPAQFGVYGIALLVLGLLEVMTETGINIFLIQEKDDLEKYLNSAWVVSILRGILIAIVILSTFPMVLFFFKSPTVEPLLYLAALIAFVRGFINPMEVSFQKNLEFGKEFSFQSILFSVDAIVSVMLGIITKSESAFLWGMLVSAIVEVILSFIIFKSRPKFEANIVKIKKVINAGKWITGAGFFGYLFQNIDNIVVGRFLGIAPLGFYQQAYKISTLPITEVGQIFNKVTFPVYVNIAEDLSRLKKAFWKTLMIILGLLLPFGILVFVFSKPLILILLGENWIAVEPALKVLAIFGVVKALLNTSYSLFLSLKMQKTVMLSELWGIIGIGIFIVPLVANFGLVGAGMATIIGVMFSLPIIVFNLIKVFKNA
jgi:O-antigen/teichoic acid export membrane protein